MKREYVTGTQDHVNFFTGIEVEKTPAFGKQTLFVTGIQSIDDITNAAYAVLGTDHIFFGANHSFCPADSAEWLAWEEMITHFLKKDYWCSLDIPLSHVEEFNDGGLNEYNRFIPQIRVPIPYLKLWNYNTMVKIDDVGFNATNPGVWCHSLHSLTDRQAFTDWSKYSNDEPIG